MRENVKIKTTIILTMIKESKMSRVIECENGHYYDADKFSSCPHCIQEKKYNRNHNKKMQTVNDENTLRMNMLSNGVSPVIGWLVCTKGFMRGQDYRLLSGFNRIGNQASDDIIIFDENIEKEKSVCSIVYDDGSGSIYLIPEGDIPVFLNHSQVNDIMLMHSEDMIQIYDTEYMLILFCPNKYRWDLNDEK